MRIHYDNKIDSVADANLTPLTEAGSFPVENIKDTSLLTYYRSNSASAQTIVIDAGTGSTITASSFALAYHNITSAGSVIIQANSADSWTSPGLSSNVTIREDIMLNYFTETTDRYWRVYFNDTSISDDYIYIGRIFLGTYIQVDPTSNPQFPVRQVRNDTFNFSQDGQLFGTLGINYKIVRYDFPKTSDSMKGSIETMWDTCGKVKPIFFVNYDTSYTVVPPIYCQISNDIEFIHLENDYWSYKLELRECK